MFLSELVKKEIYSSGETRGVCLGIGVSLKTNAVKYLLCACDKQSNSPDFALPISAILSVDDKMRARLLRTIDLLAKNGTALRMPYSEHLVDGIFEIRAKSGSNISRVLYFFVIGRKIVLTNGFVKKTQKTPKNEIDLAKKYRNEFLNREGK